MPPNILFRAFQLSVEEQKDLYDTYLETRFRKIAKGPHYLDVQEKMLHVELSRYREALEKDLDELNYYIDVRNEEMFTYIKRRSCIKLRLKRLNEFSNEYQLFSQPVVWFIGRSVYDHSYILDRRFV